MLTGKTWPSVCCGADIHKSATFYSVIYSPLANVIFGHSRAANFSDIQPEE